MKNKGFTLIELLAVIVVLGIISLITVPIVTGVIKTAKMSSFRSSANGLVNSAKIYYSKQVKGTEGTEFNGINFSFGKDDENIKLLDIKGKQPVDGNVILTSNGQIKVYVTDGEFCAFKDFESTDVTISEGKECTIKPVAPTIEVVTKKITSNTVAVVAQCTHDNGIEKYEFIKDGEISWLSRQSNGKYLNYYVFDKLENNEDINKHIFRVKCTSGSGTAIETEKEVSLTEIDNPIINIDDTWSQSKNITITYPSGRYTNEYSIDGETWNKYEGQFKIEKNLTIYARSVDKAQNEKTASAQITRIDRIAPTCEFGGESTTWRQSATIKATCKDVNGSGCIDATATKLWEYTSGATKTAELSYKITDKAGNSATCKKTANVYVDKIQPTCGGYSGSSTTWTSGDRTIHVGCSDANSGCTSGAFQQTFTTNYKQAFVNIVIRDNAGNTNTCSALQDIYVAKYASIEYDTILDNQDIKYSGNGNIGGTVGQSRGINNIQIRAEATNISGGISYQVHMQTLDNRSPISDGWFLLNDQKITDKRIEKINAHLTGDMANAFDLYYRVHVRNQGWLNVVKGNETDWTGSSGLCKRIEAIQMKIVPKNSGVPTFSSEGSTISTNATILNTSNATNNCQTSSPSTATGDVCSSKTCTYVYYTAKSSYAGSNCDPVCSQMGGTLVPSYKCNPSSSCCCKTTTYTRHTGEKACCS